MKKTVRCGNCDRVIKKAGSFTAELTQNKVIGGIKLEELENIKIRLCRPCAAKAGYKVRELGQKKEEKKL